MVAAYASARARLGQTLSGKYLVEEVLGVGGTAVVYRAQHRNGHRVAVKMLHDYLCRSDDVRRRFMREAYLANMLDHPGTVRVLDDDQTDGGDAFLVLELLEGETLEDRRVRMGGRLPLDEVLGYAEQLLGVLEVAHGHGIVHRDIKPSNLFLTNDGVLKVLDFGIARIVDDLGGATVTKTGQTMGTPAFMPPEQALSKPREVDAQSDLWAVGATIFMLLSGELVHVAESSSEHLVKAATMHARSLAKVLPGVPERVEALVAKSLAFYKRDRWADAKEMRHQLWEVRLDPGKPIGTPSSPPPRRSPTSDIPTIVGHPADAASAAHTTGPVTSERPPAVAPRARPLVLAASAAALAVGLALLGLGVHAAMAERGVDAAATAATTTLTKRDVPPPSDPPPPATTETAPAPIGSATPPPATATASPTIAKRTVPPHATPPKPARDTRGAAPAPTVDIYKPF